VFYDFKILPQMFCIFAKKCKKFEGNEEQKETEERKQTEIYYWNRKEYMIESIPYSFAPFAFCRLAAAVDGLTSTRKADLANSKIDLDVCYPLSDN
jgi:hypothetical protein